MNKVFIKLLTFKMSAIMLLYAGCVMEEVHFLPELTTNAATGITASSATIGGNITYAGEPPYIERGVVYSTTPNPTVANLKKIVAGTGKIEGKGSFTAELTGLSANTTYYARAYAENIIDISYGEQVSFIPLAIDMVTVMGGKFDMGQKGVST